MQATNVFIPACLNKNESKIMNQSIAREARRDSNFLNRYYICYKFFNQIDYMSFNKKEVDHFCKKYYFDQLSFMDGIAERIN